jgi:hypothetical protein
MQNLINNRLQANKPTKSSCYPEDFVYEKDWKFIPRSFLGMFEIMRLLSFHPLQVQHPSCPPFFEKSKSLNPQNWTKIQSGNDLTWRHVAAFGHGSLPGHIHANTYSDTHPRNRRYNHPCSYTDQ